MKMSEYNTEVGASDKGESDATKRKDGPNALRSESIKRAMKSTKQKLRR